VVYNCCIRNWLLLIYTNISHNDNQSSHDKSEGNSRNVVRNVTNFYLYVLTLLHCLLYDMIVFGSTVTSRTLTWNTNRKTLISKNKRSATDANKLWTPLRNNMDGLISEHSVAANVGRGIFQTFLLAAQYVTLLAIYNNIAVKDGFMERSVTAIPGAPLHLRRARHWRVTGSPRNMGDWNAKCREFC
jgi:hypothetical protein